jgi:tetrahydromethanopterin S-methyltransferase subunit G
MTDYVTRTEFEQLATRVDIVEREVDGEKMVTRHVLTETRRNSDDLAAIKTRLDRVEQKVDGVAQELGEVRKELAGVRGMVSGLAATLPGLIADTMREVLKERDNR